jgi:histone H3/H4
VSQVAKRMGQLWSNLTKEEKEAYQQKARKEKEVYEKHRTALLKMMDSKQHDNVSSTNDDDDHHNKKNQNMQTTNDFNSMTLPVSRIRKISRLDPDVKGLSKESTLLITKSAELFLHKIANDSCSMAKLNHKRTIYTQDIVDVCSLKDVFFFLKDDITNLVNEQKMDKKRKRGIKSVSSGAGANDEEENGNGKSHKTATSSISGVKPLTSYFAAASTSATTKS